MYYLVQLKHILIHLIMASAIMENTSENQMEVTEKTPLDNIRELHPLVNDRTVMEKIHLSLLKIQTSPQESDRPLDGYIHCELVVQSAKSSSENSRFRVKISWTGLDVKKEIERLYEIPVHYQTVIINGQVVSDAQTLEAFNVKPTAQVIYTVLTKKKLRNAGPRLRISDFQPPREDQNTEAMGAVGGMDVETDGSSDTGGSTNVDATLIKSPSSSNRNKNRRKKKGKKR